MKYPNCFPFNISKNNNFLDIPKLNFKNLLKFQPDTKNIINVEKGKLIISNWIKEFQYKNNYIEIPKYKLGGKKFQALYNHTFMPLKKWISVTGGKIFFKIIESYRSFYLQKKLIKYDDILYLTDLMLKKKEILKQVQKVKPYIILDEAQDTDPIQFNIVLKIIGFNKNKLLFNNNGQFCMLGDPFQSVYGERTSIKFYLNIHNIMKTIKFVKELYFIVTMRSSPTIINTINNIFPNIFNDKKEYNKIDFCKLESKSLNKKGSVHLLNIINKNDFKSTRENIEYEAKSISSFILKNNKNLLGIKDWNQLAILSPRNKWLFPIANCLKEHGFNVQIHSKNNILGKNPAYIWFLSLMTIANDPENNCEIINVLKNIYNISDEAIFIYRKNKNCFHINKQHLDNNNISNILNNLYIIQKENKNTSLRSMMNNWITKTQLIEKLNNLKFDLNQEIIINDLLIMISKFENLFFGLNESIEELNKKYYNNIIEEKKLKNHIQLYSCHKAKGLEWDIVILPYIFREIRENQLHYPRFIQIKKRFLFTLDDSYILDAEKELIIHRKKNEYERLIYVAMTRACKKLILVNDETLFKRNKRSFADFLKILPDNINRNHWNNIKNESVNVSNQDNILSDQLDISIYQKKHKIPGAQKKVLKNYINSYNFLWKNIMKNAPWDKSQLKLKEFLNLKIAQYSFEERIVLEINKLLKSNILNLLNNRKWSIFTDIYFLSSKNQEKYFEGIFDILAFAKKNIEWMLIIWKTDKIKNSILKNYHKEIKICTDIINNTYQISGKAFIYNTYEGLIISS